MSRLIRINQANQSRLIVDISDDQGKIERVLEFLDSKETEKLMGLMSRAKVNVGVDGKAW
jgi:hypothetical protein